MKTDNVSKTVWISERSDSDSLKWNHFNRSEVLPMWIADMDVCCAEPILRALHQRIQHGIFGYGIPGRSTNQAVIEWLQTRHQWAIHPEWIVWTPGLVPALNVACRAFTETDGEILTFTPIYPPFLAAPGLSGRS